MNKTQQHPAATWMAVAWLATFLILALTGTTVREPPGALFPVVALTGTAIAWAVDRRRLLNLIQEHKWLWIAILLFGATVAFAEILAHQRKVPELAPFLPVPVWLLLCLPALATILSDEARMRWTIIFFLVICVWHFFTMPIEAVTGIRMSWQPIALFPREAGLLKFQAAGLAWQIYYFAGLFLPLFYLVWGPWSEGNVMRRPQLPGVVWVLMAMAWGLVAVCTQSRSAFAGTLAAALLALVALLRPRQAKAWLGLGALVLVLALVAAGAYVWLFSENKSGIDLRWAYVKLYLNESLQWPWVLTGHGFSLVPDLTMFAQGFIPLQHSHNDLLQTLYSWGALALVFYSAFWAALLRVVWQKFVSRGRLWPVCALLVFVPTTVTDLGFQHFEKAVFIVLFAAWCLVFADRVAPAAHPDPQALRA